MSAKSLGADAIRNAVEWAEDFADVKFPRGTRLRGTEVVVFPSGRSYRIARIEEAALSADTGSREG